MKKTLIIFFIFLIFLIDCNNKRELDLLNYNDSLPDIVSVSPQNGSVSSMSVPIVITFNKSMNPTSVSGSFIIKPSLDGSFEWNNNFKECKYIHTEKMSAMTAYTVIFQKGVVDRDGESIDKEYQWTFSTSPFIENEGVVLDNFESTEPLQINWDDSIITDSSAVKVTTTSYEGNYSCRFLDISNRQMYWSEETNSALEIDIRTYPYIKWAMKLEPNAATCFIIKINNSDWYCIAKSPKGKIYYDWISTAPSAIEIIDDNEWHFYTYDLNNITTSGTLDMLEFWDKSGKGTNYIYLDAFMVVEK